MDTVIFGQSKTGTCNLWDKLRENLSLIWCPAGLSFRPNSLPCIHK